MLITFIKQYINYTIKYMLDDPILLYICVYIKCLFPFTPKILYFSTIMMFYSDIEEKSTFIVRYSF